MALLLPGPPARRRAAPEPVADSRSTQQDASGRAAAPATARRPGPGPWWRGVAVRWSVPVLVAIGVAVPLAVLVAALRVGGGGPEPATAGLPTAGAFTGWGLPLLTLLVRGASVATVGALVLAALLLPRGLPGAAQVSDQAVRAAGALAAVWLAAEAVRFVLLVSTLAGVPVTRLSPSAVLDVLTGLAPGRAALVVAVLLVTVAVGSRGEPWRVAPPVLLLLALAALLAPVVLAGHSAAAGGHVLAVGSLAGHVTTAAAWVGGLGAVLLLARGLPRPGPVVRRFSALALGCVALLGLSGVTSAGVLTGLTSAPSPGAVLAVLGSGYGALLLAKTGALVLLTAAGAWHRRRTVTALEAGRPHAFARLAVVELVLMAATLAVAVALAASPPPASLPPAAPGAPADGVAAAAPSGDAAVQPPAGTADAGTADAGTADAGTAAVDPMAGHDHGELSVGVLVDATRFHVARAVAPNQPVTVYNSADVAVTITADDGSFDVAVPARTFVTFPAPGRAGRYPFSSSTDAAFADALVVEQR